MDPTYKFTTLVGAETYRVTIRFDGKAPWSKGGYSHAEALAVKTRFLETVPRAVFGVMEPEVRR